MAAVAVSAVDASGPGVAGAAAAGAGFSSSESSYPESRVSASALGFAAGVGGDDDVAVPKVLVGSVTCVSTPSLMSMRTNL